MILLSVVDEVVAAKHAGLDADRGVRLGNARQHAGPLASQHLIAVVIATIGKDGDLADPHGLLGIQAHRHELHAIVALGDNLVSDDKMMFGVDGSLQVIADNARPTAAAVHRARIRVGERDLMVGNCFDLAFHILQELHVAAQTGELLLDPVCPGFGDFAGLAVSPVECSQVALDAGVHLLDAPGDLVRREVAVPVVDCLELAAVDRNHGLSEQPQRPAQHDELPAYRPKRRAIVAPKVRDSFEVGCETSGQPHQLDIALRFTLEPTARLNPVQIAVEVDFEHRRWMVGRTPSLSGRRSGKTQSVEIELVDKGLDHPDRIVLRHAIIKRGRQQKILPAVFPFNEPAHLKASRKSEKTIASSRVFAQSRPISAV